MYVAFSKVKYFLFCGDYISFVIESVRQIAITSVHVVREMQKPSGSLGCTCKSSTKFTNIKPPRTMIIPEP